MTPRFRLLPALLLLALPLSKANAADIARPEVHDARLALTLFAAEPDIVTPIGVAVDPRGRVFVMESHTHFPKTNYPGPKADRVKILHDADGDGRAEQVSIYYEGLHHGMNLAFGPDQRLYATYRNGLVRLDDADGDGVCERRVDLLTMETPGNYPHNGIGALAFSPDGWIYVGQGENLGEKFTLKGTDGRSYSDREGGFVFRCRTDGTGLERVASGFWNPFGLAFYGGEFLVAVDNDPDSRPPNRLLDIVAGGDYGYKFRFGRSGLHPFQAWNGELPGTLPMMSGVGEGASAVMACDRTAWPASFHEALLVTAGWDHRIEVYRPMRFGASLRAEREVLVEGDQNFRPIGLATAPDGAVFFTDWVDASYNVHSKGRVWRLASQDKKASPGTALAWKAGDRAQMNWLLSGATPKDLPRVLGSLMDLDPFLVSAAITTLSRPEFREAAWSALTNAAPAIRLGALLALRRAQVTNGVEAVGPRLKDPDARVRLMAVIWAGENEMVSLTNRLAEALKPAGVTPALLRAHGATAQILTKAGGQPAGLAGATRADFDFTETPNADAAIRVLETAEGKSTLSARLDAVRALTQTVSGRGQGTLRLIAGNRNAAPELRAEAAAGLANTGSTQFLLNLVTDKDPEVRLAAARALRSASAERRVQMEFRKILMAAPFRNDDALREDLTYALELSGIHFTRVPSTVRPADAEQWRKELKSEGNAERGRRVFFSPHAGCARCHRIEDQGGRLGPDLSTIARGADREKLMQSILQPSRDIPPQFVAHTVETRDGQTWTGLLLAQTADGAVTLATMEGKAVMLPPNDVTTHTQSKVSLMPEGLDRALTVGEFRDLLTYLLTRK